MKILAMVDGIKKHKTNDGKPRKYHIWYNNDTKCTMYSTGGLGDVANIKLIKKKVNDSEFSKMRKKGEICSMCISYGNENLENNGVLDTIENLNNGIESKEFLYNEIYEGEE